MAAAQETCLVWPFTTEAEWLEARRYGVGGSDAAALFGCNPYKSSYELWAEKSGLLERSVLESEAMRWGKVLEEPIAERYVQDTGRRLIDHGRYTIFRSKACNFMFCTPDREIVGDPRGRGMLSIKNVTQFKADDWEHEPPDYYQIQLQHELAVTGAEWGSFAVLIGGNKFHWLDVERNDAFIDLLFERVEAMRARIKTMDPPPVDGSARTTEALRKLYAGESGETIQLADSFIEVANELEAIKAHIKSLEKDAAERKNKLIAAIGSASYAALADGSSYSFKTVKKKGHVVAPSEYRQLTRRNAK